MGQSSIFQENWGFCPKRHVSPGPCPLAPEFQFLICPWRGSNQISVCRCRAQQGVFKIQIPGPHPEAVGGQGP